MYKYLWLLLPLWMAVFASRCLCQCPSRRHMIYTNGVVRRVLKERICKSVDMSKGNLQWWRIIQGQTQQDSEGWQGALYRLGERAAAAGKDSWKGASGRGGSWGASWVQQKGNPLSLPPPASAAQWLSPAGRHRAEKGEKGRPGRQMESVQYHVQI